MPEPSLDSVEALLNWLVYNSDYKDVPTTITKLDKIYASKFIELIGEEETLNEALPYLNIVRAKKYVAQIVGKNELRAELRKAVKEVWDV